MTRRLPFLICALLVAPIVAAAQRATYPPECPATVVKAIATPDTLRVRCVRDRARVDLFNAQAAYATADATRTVKATALAAAVKTEAAAVLAYNVKLPPPPPPAPPDPTPKPPVVNGPTPAVALGTATAAELPRSVPSTVMPPAGRVVRIAANANLQAALNGLQLGDELRLPPCAVYTGEFVLPNKGPGSSWIVIRTDVADSALGAPGTRMTPTRARGACLAKILTPTNQPALITADGAHHYRLTGVEISATGGRDVYSLLQLGGFTAAAPANNLVLDRSYVHGLPTLDLRRCVVLNSASTAIVDSWLGECHSNQGDSQALLGTNGPGPFLVENSTLEGGHMAFMFGGGDPAVTGLVPCDITMRRNYMGRPAAWQGIWGTKTIAETKNACRLLLEANVLENVWVSGQVGFALLFKSSNQDGRCTWCITSDVTVRYNRIRNVAALFNIAARPELQPAQPAARFLIHDNYADGVDVPPFTGPGIGLQVIGDVADLVFAHNTVDAPKGNSATMFDGGKNTRFVFHSNVMSAGENLWGFIGTGAGLGNGTLAAFTVPPVLFSHNVFPQAVRCDLYPPTTLCPSSWPATLPAGFDGRPAGADLARVAAATAGVVVAP